MGWVSRSSLRHTDWLEPHEQRLFDRQSSVDQQHAYQVASWLLARGHHDRILIRAALLHDIGKAGPRITVIHRIVWVITGRFGLFLRQPLALRSRAFRHLADHARIGASVLQNAQSDPRVVALVSGHPLADDVERARLLHRADDAV